MRYFLLCAHFLQALAELHKVSTPVTFEEFLFVCSFPREISVSETVD